MPDDVGRAEVREGDAVDAAEDAAHHVETGALPAGQVDLGGVAGDDHLGAEAESGEEHLHLRGRGVLRLVEDDECVVQRPAAHVRERGDFDDAGLHEFRDHLRVHHVAQRVVEGPQVGVDFFVEGAGQEAEVFAGFDGGAGQDDPFDVLALQRLDGLGHGQVGLAGAGGADAEDDGVAVDGVDVVLLALGFGPDDFAAAGDDLGAEDVGGTAGSTCRPVAGVGSDDADGARHGVGGQFVAAACHRFEFLEGPGRGGDLGGAAGDGDGGAAGVDVRAEEVLEEAQVAVGVPEHGRRVRGVEFDDRLGAVVDGVSLGASSFGLSGRIRHAGWNLVSLAGWWCGSVRRLVVGAPGRGVDGFVTILGRLTGRACTGA